MFKIWIGRIISAGLLSCAVYWGLFQHVQWVQNLLFSWVWFLFFISWFAYHAATVKPSKLSWYYHLSHIAFIMCLSATGHFLVMAGMFITYMNFTAANWSKDK